MGNGYVSLIYSATNAIYSNYRASSVGAETAGSVAYGGGETAGSVASSSSSSSTSSCGSSFSAIA